MWLPFLIGWMVDDGLPVERLDLESAVEQGVVNAVFLSSGGSSEHCVNVALRNTENRPVEIVVPGGTRLAHPEAQDILVTRESVIALAPQGQGHTSLYGFCMEPSEFTPNDGDRFTLATDQADKAKWEELASFLSEKELSADEEQSVVWASTDDYPLAGIRFDSNDHTDLVDWLEDTREEELPSYRLDYGELTNRRFTNDLQEVRGVLHYAAEGDHRRSKLEVQAPDGSVVMTIFDGDPIEAGTYYRFRFRIRGSMLDRGTYTMVLSSGSAILKTVEVSV